MNEQIWKCRLSFLSFNRLSNARKNSALNKKIVTIKTSMALNRKTSKTGTTNTNRNNKLKNPTETRKSAIDLKVKLRNCFSVNSFSSQALLSR